MRGPPQSGFASAMVRTRSASSEPTCGRPIRPRRDFQVQKARNPWLIWNSTCWVRDEKNQLLTWAQDTIRAVAIAASLQGDVGLLKHARKSESKYRLQAMIQLAAADPRVVLSSDQLDSDPCLFNVQNGTIDLRTGAVSPHDPGQLIT